MFDPRSDYALNKLDPDAIVCKSATGQPIRITRADFDSEEGFLKWKAFSDQDYHSIEAGSREDDNCFSLTEQLDAVAPSAEEMMLAKIQLAEKVAENAALMKRLNAELTESQRRRLILNLVENMTTREIAKAEGKAQQVISRSIIAAKKKLF